MRPLKPLKFTLTLLNGAHYQDPDGSHTWRVTSNEQGRKLLHVPGCPDLVELGRGYEQVGTYRELCVLDRGAPSACTRCQPHASHHVVLPDGARRYRPMGPIMSGGTESDRRYGEYALVDLQRGRWRIREWAVDGETAIARAAKLGVPYILGPSNAKLGLPTPIPQQ
ncbi:hypothetical protein ABZ912_30100 [Nonomuraea angiospora]|uniref:hypothetical protein n=1 Tax=Nonomuraea angiospora TaxID=46172 RepID=UPI0033C11A6F